MGTTRHDPFETRAQKVTHANLWALGKDVMQNMFDEFITLFHELTDNDMCL